MVPILKDLTLELTQKCFQECLYCSSNSSSINDTELPFETVKQILDDFSSLGGKVVELSGGEPLAYEKVYETVEYASERGLEIHLFTCSNAGEEICLDKLREVDRFYVNLQAPNSVIHDYLAQTTGSFSRATDFIKKCKRNGKWVGTHFVPLSANIDEIEEYVELAELLKLDNVSLLRFVEQGRGRKNILSLNSDERLHLLSLIEEYRHIESFQFKIGCPLDFGFVYKKSRSAIPCSSAISRCVVRPNGNVIPCPAFKDVAEFVAGNAKNDSLGDIWEKSAVFQKLRDFDPKKLRGLCTDCPFLDICRGRCHAQRYHHYGDLYQGPDPYCPLGLSRPRESKTSMP